MNVLVACEFSGVVRDAFIRKGHNAISCDLLPTEVCGPHIKADVMEIIKYFPPCWDLLIAHPPCTYLTCNSTRWFKDRQQEQKDAIQFVKDLLSCSIKHIAIENPIGMLSSAIRKPDQIIQPWQFGHGETNATCLWLTNLPCLVPTKIVETSSTRGMDKNQTYKGIAEAMAEQWG